MTATTSLPAPDYWHVYAELLGGNGLDEEIYVLGRRSAAFRVESHANAMARDLRAAGWTVWVEEGYEDRDEPATEPADGLVVRFIPASVRHVCQNRIGGQQ